MTTEVTESAEDLLVKNMEYAAVIRSLRANAREDAQSIERLIKERDEAREAARLITMDESEYAAKCIEVYATITPEGIEDLPPEMQRIIHEMHKIGERLSGKRRK